MTNRRSVYQILARWLLCLYPAAWRDRYGDEMDAVLQLHPVSFWTIIDLGLGAIDAHLRHDLLPNRLASDDQRLRSSEVAIFCAFVLFFVPWLALQRIRDPLAPWEHAVLAHPEIRLVFIVVQWSGVVAVLAILAGGIPIVLASLRQAIISRDWLVGRLFVVPPIAAGLLACYASLASLYWTQTVPNAPPTAPFTPLAIVLQLGLAVLVGVTIVVSTGALAGAVANSLLSPELLRFAMLPAIVATAAIAVGFLASLVLGLLTQREAPELGDSGFLATLLVLLMGGAVVLGVTAMRHGRNQASHPTSHAAGE